MDDNLDFKKMLQITARSELPVLITGESGVGKEVAARQLHALSKRSDKAFIAVNCGAVSIGIANSMFSGHVKGAFTGASGDQQGFIRAADEGTLFLDEVAELSLENQKILLRALQEKTVMPVGSQIEINVDFRLICATNRDLSFLVEKGFFRQDLYFRLAILPIKIPPLRERADLQAIAESLWKHPEPLSYQNLQMLKEYSWPGNIRQLKNVLERYALFKNHGYSLKNIISAESEQCGIYLKESPPKYRPNISKISDEIETCKGNKSRAARKLGISRGSLYYQMRKNINSD